MTDNRYRYDTGSIIDQKTGEILTERKTVNRLNRQDRRIKIKERHIDAMINQLNKEIENSTGELKQALIRIANTELELWNNYPIKKKHY